MQISEVGDVTDELYTAHVFKVVVVSTGNLRQVIPEWKKHAKSWGSKLP